MNKRNKLISLLAISLLCVSGCNKSKHHAIIEINHPSKEGKTIDPKDVTLKDTKYSIENDMLNNLQVLPSIGDINILVIPILLPDFSEIDINNDGIDDKDKVHEDIEKAFFAEENEKYESVTSFYKKSSFAKLNLAGEVTPWFDVKEYTEYQYAVEIDYYETYDLVRTAVNWAKDSLKIDMDKYDSDNDGYIDGVWCIYSCPNLRNGGPQTDYGNYWAYTSWGNQSNEVEKPSVDNPIYNLFGWASYDFMYDGYGINCVDAHTYIHETGHFLGLNDYYSDQSSYNPLGKLDMMDANITDHNSYSKMLLGWTKPYVVTGKTKINLKSIYNENSLIVIPSDETKIIDNTFDPFSEYILIELYSNEGINEIDSLEKYENGFKGLSTIGIKIYHIDNRRFIIDTSDSLSMTCKEYKNETIDKNHRLVLPINNSRGIDNYNIYFNLDVQYNLYDEIRLIEKSNIDTFSTGGILKEKSLFMENDTFSMNKYGDNFFFNENKFNNGDNFNYEITIKEVK